MKTLHLITSIALPLVYLGCVNSDPVGNGAVAPPRQEFAMGITLTYRSGINDTLLTMPEPVPQSEGTDAPSGEWVTTLDTAGIMVSFVSSDPAFSVGSATVMKEYSSAELRVLPDFIVHSDGGAVELPQVSAGLLTAGEWNDHSHWDEFRTFIREYPSDFCKWQLNLQRRALLKVVDADNTPVPGAHITVALQDKTVFEGTSLGDGSVAFFPLNHRCGKPDHFDVRVDNPEFSFNGEFTPVDDDDQTWVIKVDQSTFTDNPVLDLVFTVDVTGSMVDELSYLQAELVDICDKIYAGGINRLRVGFIFYRDRGDEFVTKIFPFSDDVVAVKNSISFMKADGGGDGPESVNLALKNTVQNLEWRTDRNCIRLCFMVADAPPHYYHDEQYIYSDALDEAVTRGIKLIPVAGSGIDKSTEYLFRHMAVKTMGKYIFITDDSGIGGTHIDPDIGAHDVETLNEIIVRTINEEVRSRQ